MGVMKNEIGRPSNKTIMIRRILKGVVILPIIALLAFAYYKANGKKTVHTNTVSSKKLSKYVMENNSLSDFDLFFLKEENNGKNRVYSPLSIKYALALIKEGASGNTKEQINSVIENYKFKKYENSKNINLKNVLFIKNSFKDNVNENYIKLIKNKYNSDVIFDDFNDANSINSWISDNTLKLINNMFSDSDIQDKDFVMGNALAIDMEWVNKIQKEKQGYYVSYPHEKYKDVPYCSSIAPFLTEGFTSLKFNDGAKEYNSVKLAADINNYDIVNKLGEDNIRKTVSDEYNKWLKSDESKYCNSNIGVGQKYTTFDEYLDDYIKDLNSNYQRVDSSTDFLMYSDENVKSFAKDLKKYNGVTLQYIGIMPQKEDLSTYIKNVNSSKINKIIKNLKEIKSESFEDGVVTKISANIPVFDYEYSLDLKNDLIKMGITDAFEENKADLSKFSKQKGTFISDTVHKANISFSNDGIKASAVTLAGGMGDGGCDFDYLYEIPVKEIDLTFDKPYMYIIRDKESGEVWFAGSVYEPNLYTQNQ